MSHTTRIGLGFDVHRLARGRRLVLGGLDIECNVGLEGHSDGDVLLHAVTDAIIGACATGDIGDHFSNTDPRWKDANSNEFLQEALARAEEAGFEISNVDSVIVAEKPHLGAWKEAIRSTLAGLLGLPVDRVNVKAKTMEGLGAVGEGRAIEAHAVVLLFRDDAAPRRKARAAKRAAPARRAKTAKRPKSAKPARRKAAKKAR